MTKKKQRELLRKSALKKQEARETLQLEKKEERIEERQAARKKERQAARARSAAAPSKNYLPLIIGAVILYFLFK